MPDHSADPVLRDAGAAGYWGQVIKQAVYDAGQLCDYYYGDKPAVTYEGDLGATLQYVQAACSMPSLRACPRHIELYETHGMIHL